MPLPDGRSTGTMELVDVEYFDWEPEGSPVSIHMHRDTIDAISRDVTDAWKTLARPVLETGGLLLGRVEPGERPKVWIERYQRVECRHKAGPRFVLDEEDTAGLEKAAADVLSSGETAVVGFYRSHLRDGLQLEDSDYDLVRRYFSDAADLILLIKPESPFTMSGQFFVHGTGTGGVAAGAAFPFHGHPLVGAAEEPRPAEPTPRERPRRLVPDFAPLQNAALPVDPPVEEPVSPSQRALLERATPERGGRNVERRNVPCGNRASTGEPKPSLDQNGERPSRSPARSCWLAASCISSCSKCIIRRLP